MISVTTGWQVAYSSITSAWTLLIPLPESKAVPKICTGTNLLFGGQSFSGSANSYKVGGTTFAVVLISACNEQVSTILPVVSIEGQWSV
jgi:hypothetical protein